MLLIALYIHPSHESVLGRALPQNLWLAPENVGPFTLFLVKPRRAAPGIFGCICELVLPLKTTIPARVTEWHGWPATAAASGLERAREAQET